MLCAESIYRDVSRAWRVRTTTKAYDLKTSQQHAYLSSAILFDRRTNGTRSKELHQQREHVVFLIIAQSYREAHEHDREAGGT